MPFSTETLPIECARRSPSNGSEDAGSTPATSTIWSIALPPQPAAGLLAETLQRTQRSPPEMAACARECEGFVSSRLLRRDDGTLADEVVWTSREAAQMAAAQVESIPQAARYFAHMNQMVSMEHAEIVVS